MLNEVEIAVKDSLKRQIIEAKRQIDQIRNRNKSKFLEIRRKTDQRKARVVLTTLKLKKQLQDFQTFLEESRKQWNQDLQTTQDHVLVSLTQKFESFTKLQKSFKSSQISQIISSLTSIHPVPNNLEEAIESHNISSGDITIEQECSTDVVYLSTYLKAVIEGSTLDRFSSNDRIYMKVLNIVKELNKYVTGIFNENSLKSTKTAGLGENSLIEDFCEQSPVKKVDQSVFSFSSPEVRDKEVLQREFSVSSEWHVEGDLLSEDSGKSQDDSGKWNSISNISAHSASVSQRSESCESAELLNSGVVRVDGKIEGKISCWKKMFCCLCKER